MIAVGQRPFLLDRLLGTGEPGAPLLAPGGEVADLGQALVLAHLLDHPVEFGPLGEPVGLDLGHRRERPVEEAERAVGIELRRARGHPVGELALQFDMADQLGPRVLEVLDVDRETGHRPARQRHVDEAQHAPLAVDDRGLHPRHDPRLLLSHSSETCRAFAAGRVDQLELSLDHLGRAVAVDGLDERLVDEARASGRDRDTTSERARPRSAG